MEFKKFRSTKGDIRVASLSGHVSTIGEELVSVPDVLWAQAYAAGAISEDMKVSDMTSYLEEKKQEVEDQKAKERAEVKEVLKEIYANPIGFIDSKNRPILRRVLGKIQKPVKKDYIDEIWDEIVSEEE